LVKRKTAAKRKHILRVPLHRPSPLLLPRRRGVPKADDERAVKDWVKYQSKPHAIDLFCGAGGLSLGLKQAGFSVLVGADHESTALMTHTSNVGGLGYGGDLSDASSFLRQLRRWGITHVDLVAAGLPCQPFSSAGRSKIRSLVRQGLRKQHDPRTLLWKSFAQIVRTLRPALLVIENVPDLAIWNDGMILQELTEQLARLGYDVDVRVLRASDFGVPQHRKRVFVVGVRKGVAFYWPPAVTKSVSLRDAIGDLPRVDPGQRRDQLPYRGPKSMYQRRMRVGVRTSERAVIRDHITREVRTDDAVAFALLRPGQTYTDLPARLRRYRSDIFKDKYKRLEWGESSRTITAHLAKDGYSYIHPAQHRTLSVREAARIQSFPDWFRFAGTPTIQYRQIGNAVPPRLALAVARSLYSALDGNVAHPRPAASSMRARLLMWHRRNRRVFPWREYASAPWLVLLAEVALRRTRASQVARHFDELVRFASTPRKLLRNEDAVRGIVSHLGLRWRADNLIDLSRELVENHASRVPKTEAELRALPGVGEYVSRAVLAFGWNRPAILIDTNTTRVASRYAGRQLNSWELRAQLYELAGRPGPDANFNYAVLDLGATVCRFGEPLCEACPLRVGCRTYAAESGDRPRRRR
jgi:DNA (cytosine-5)-methyltransferase 1